MVRTRVREDQAVDVDFLTEQEGSERFIFRQGQGTNDTNVILEPTYYMEADRFHIDGYTRFVDLVSDPTDSLPANSLYLYNKAGFIYTRNSAGDTKELGVALTVSETVGATTVSRVTEIEFNDSYGFNVVNEGSGKVRIDFGSSWNPLQVSGQSDLDASGEEALEIIAGSNMTITTNTGSSPKSITFNSTGASTGSISPIVKIGNTTQTLNYGVGSYSKFGNAVSIAISVSFSKTGSGDISIEGLPYTSNTTANLEQVLSTHAVGLAGGVFYGGPLYGSGGGGEFLQANLAANSAVLYFKTFDSSANATDTVLDTSTTLHITGTYLTS